MCCCVAAIPLVLRIVFLRKLLCYTSRLLPSGKRFSRFVNSRGPVSVWQRSVPGAAPECRPLDAAPPIGKARAHVSPA